MKAFACLIQFDVVEVSVDGVRIEFISNGDQNNYPRRGDKLTVHYVGYRGNDGVKFESSYDSNKPLAFTFGEGKVLSQ